MKDPAYNIIPAAISDKGNYIISADMSDNVYNIIPTDIIVNGYTL